MADTSVQDVVNQSQSVGDLSPADAAATTTTTDSQPLGDVDGVAEVAIKENGVHSSSLVPDLDDISARSDTDGSRAEGSVAGDKPTESKPLKKFTPAKPVSFAKYSVPKVIAANAAAKGVDKGMIVLCSGLRRIRTDNSRSSHSDCFSAVTSSSWSTTFSCKNCECSTKQCEGLQTCCS